MTTIAENLATAQEAVRRAEQDVQRAKNAKIELKQTLADGRSTTTELNKAIRDIRRADAARVEADNEIKAINNQLAVLHPPPATSFPSDAENVSLERKAQGLMERRAKAVTRKQTAEKQASDARLRAINLDRQLAGLRNSAAQLESLSKGEVPEHDWRPKGGLLGVA